MAKFTDKPVTIEAIQFTGFNPDEIKDFVGESCEVEYSNAVYVAGAGPMAASITIHTLEGDMKADKGDYIIKGVQGEFYPCKPDIFEKIYTAVTDDAEGMTFGAAIEALKHGKFVARRGWNGKGMYLWLMQPATVKAEWCKEPHLKALAEKNGGTIEALGSIRMLTADGKILTGWLASQADILSEDWIIVNPK